MQQQPRKRLRLRQKQRPLRLQLNQRRPRLRSLRNQRQLPHPLSQLHLRPSRRRLHPKHLQLLLSRRERISRVRHSPTRRLSGRGDALGNSKRANDNFPCPASTNRRRSCHRAKWSDDPGDSRAPRQLGIASRSAGHARDCGIERFGVHDVGPRSASAATTFSVERWALSVERFLLQ